MEVLTIGKVARCAGVGIETVRFYEREGLIAEPPRGSSGYRQYPADTVSRIRFIRRAKELGFSLKEVQDLCGCRLLSRVGYLYLASDVRSAPSSRREFLSQLVPHAPRHFRAPQDTHYK